jgi:hypothetical protein
MELSPMLGDIYLKYEDIIKNLVFERGMINQDFNFRIGTEIALIINNIPNRHEPNREYWLKLPIYNELGVLKNYRILKIVSDKDGRCWCKGIIEDEVLPIDLEDIKEDVQKEEELEKQQRQITTIIEEMNIDEQFYLFRQYREDVDYYDDMPERVEDIDELYCGMTPSEILDELEGLNTNWDYFCFNEYGNVEQWEGIDCISDVVDYIIENENELGNDDIQEVLDKYTSTQEFYIEKEDVNKVGKVVQELELKILSEEYDYMIIL